MVPNLILVRFHAVEPAQHKPEEIVEGDMTNYCMPSQITEAWHGEKGSNEV